ncbi:MAG: FecR domain-containing protein, partial [Acidiferrobacterales bacterium]
MNAVSKRFISLSSLTFFVALLLVSWCAPVQGAIKPVGEVILANGTFLAIQSDSSSRSLTRGSEFYQGDRLWTGPTTKAQVRFSDGAIMTLRADTEFRVDEYEFDNKNKGRNKSLFTLVKGGFRTITGLISRLKPESYRVKTSYAIVGVRGTTYETVVDNALYVAAWQGTVSVTNDAGETTLGFGEDANFARVSGANRRAVTLLEAPPQLLESVDPALQEFVTAYQRLVEILPSEGTLVRQGFAVFGGADSGVSPLTAPMIGAGGTDSDARTVLVDSSTGRILRQGAAGLFASANPLPGVSWGAWAGGPVEVQTLAGTTPVPRPAFWLTMAPPSNLPTSGSANYSLVS